MPASPIDGAIRTFGREVPNLNIFDIDLGRPRARTVVTWSSHPAITGPGWLERARATLARLPPGGLLAGFLGYEAGRDCEVMPDPISAPPLPDVWLRPCDGYTEFRAASGTWHTFGTAPFRAQAEELLARSAAREGARPPPSATDLDGPGGRYEQGVRTALARIHDGEVYQVNLAWELRSPPLAQPLEAWLALRDHNPARRGAFVQVDPDHTIVSNSPETFLDVEPWGDALRVRSVPIKGTARRSEGPAGWQRLESSEKERAELTMIVDLVRNDLGRVAPWGAVRTGPRTLAFCGDLIHAEQEVEATLRPGLDALDAVRAAFPPGSVTGAPKVRAMQLIRELEAGPRGVYTGTMGVFFADGRAHTNVAIRTATCGPQSTRFHVGAGIVADSDPAAEWRETLAKGARLHAVLHAARTQEDPHA